MKILLSAYACETNRGSEPGIGWNWTVEMAKLGHDVVTLTYPQDREGIDQALEEDFDLPNLRIEYLDTPKWLTWFYSRTSKKIYVHYILWQIMAYFRVKKMLKTEDFDFIQHVTMGSIRVPSWLGFLKPPFIFGPVGGGEEAPMTLVKNLPSKYFRKEYVRKLANRFNRINPFLWIMLWKTDVILCKTSDSARFFPKRFQKKCHVQMECGIHNETITDLVNIRESNYVDAPKFFYAGRLQYMKGLHLNIRVFARLLKDFPNAKYTMVGEGPDKEWLQSIAEAEGALDNIEFKGLVPQPVLFEMYRTYDLLLFLSLHDSSGNVVLESLAKGLPSIVLDLGGPKEIVDEECGLVVPTGGMSEDEIVEKAYQMLRDLMMDKERLNRMKIAGLEAARRKQWHNVVGETVESLSELTLAGQ
ncbi:MAG: glycosyltransferase [Bacteroidota bacterium]